MGIRRSFALSAFVLLLSTVGLGAPSEVRFEQRIGEKLPLNTIVTDEYGKAFPLSAYFHQKPVVFVFAYYECPNLCTLVLNGLTNALKSMPYKLGKQYDIVTLSIDPAEKPPLALAKKRSYLARYGEPLAEDAWHFLTARPDSIRALTEKAGFHFQYDPLSKQYSHPSGIVIAAPNGTITQYYFGIQFDPRALQKSIDQASRSKLGKIKDEILLYCFHYDPQSSKNGPLLLKIVRFSGALGAALLALLLWALFRKERFA